MDPNLMEKFLGPVEDYFKPCNFSPETSPVMFRRNIWSRRTAPTRGLSVESAGLNGCCNQKKPPDGRVSSMSRSSVSSTSGTSNQPLGIDEESFEQAFTSTTVVQIFSSKDLKAQLDNIRETLSDCNNDWEKRYDAMKRLRSLVISGATEYEDFMPSLKLLEIPMQTTLKDLRSQIVREACFTLSFLAIKLKLSFDHFAESVLPNLQALLQNSAKVMSSSAIYTIKYILRHTHAPRLIPVIIAGLESKSKEIRRHTCEFIYLILNEWNPQNMEKYSVLLQESIRTGINDADVEARMYSRSSFHLFRNHFPMLAEKLLQTLEGSKRKLLQGELSNSSGNLSTNGKSKLSFPRKGFNSSDTMDGSICSSKPLAIPRSTTPKLKSYGTARSKLKCTSQSQPASRSNSPSLNAFFSGTNNGHASATLGRKTPHSLRYNSRESSPTRRRISERSQTPNSYSRMTRYPRPATNGCCNTDKRSKQFGLDSDEASETSSLCSERSHYSFNNKAGEEFNEMVRLLSSNQWIDKHDGLLILQNMLNSKKNFSKLEVRAVIEHLMKLFSDAHGKVFTLFLDVLHEFIPVYHEEMNDCLHHLIYGLLSKANNDSLSSVSQKVHLCVEKLKRCFDVSSQFNTAMHIVSDDNNILKLKLSLLRYITDLISLMRPLDMTASPEVSAGLTAIINMTSDKKSSELRKLSSKVLVLISTLNPAEFSLILSKIPKGFRLASSSVLDQYLRNSYNAMDKSSDEIHSSADMHRKISSRGTSSELNHDNEEYGSEELLDDFNRMSITSNLSTSTIQDKENYLGSVNQMSVKEQNDYLSSLIVQISKQNNPTDVRFTAMDQLMNAVDDICPAVWNNHFETVLLLMLRTLNEPFKILQVNSLRILQRLLKSSPERFSNYIELTILKFLEFQRDSHNEVSFAIEETLTTAALSLPSEECIRVLRPIIETASHPVNLTAIRMMNKALSMINESVCKVLLPEIGPCLISAWDSEYSSVRKAAVFCLVTIYKHVGEAMRPLLNGLPNSKLKLLNVYISRTQTSDTDRLSPSKSSASVQSSSGASEM